MSNFDYNAEVTEDVTKVVNQLLVLIAQARFDIKGGDVGPVNHAIQQAGLVVKALQDGRIGVGTPSQDPLPEDFEELTEDKSYE